MPCTACLLWSIFLGILIGSLFSWFGLWISWRHFRTEYLKTIGERLDILHDVVSTVRLDVARIVSSRNQESHSRCGSWTPIEKTNLDQLAPTLGLDNQSVAVLRQIGISTIFDLASADPSSLQEKLKQKGLDMPISTTSQIVYKALSVAEGRT